MSVMCVSEALFSGKSNGTPMGTNSAPAIQFSNTFLYIDDLFSVNNEEFGDNITQFTLRNWNLRIPPHHNGCVRYLEARFQLGDNNSPFHVSIYDKIR